MSAAAEYSDADKRKVFADLVNFIDDKKAKTENTKKEFDDKFKEWKIVRINAIREMGNIAKCIKTLNDEMTWVQTGLKTVSMVAKSVTFAGPTTAMIGSGAALAADVGYSVCSKHKVDELEKMSNMASQVLEEDAAVTEDLFSLMSRMRVYSEDIKEGVKKLHAATVRGFFDSVASLLPFSSSVRTLSTVEEPRDIQKFLEILWDEAKGLAMDPDFMTYFNALTTYNPGVFELIVTIPEICLNAGILYTTYTGTDIAVAGVSLQSVTKTLNAIAISADFADIVNKILEYNKYPKLSIELKKIKKKLEREQQNILKAATRI